jgi:hypothetical protein
MTAGEGDEDEPGPSGGAQFHGLLASLVVLIWRAEAEAAEKQGRKGRGRAHEPLAGLSILAGESRRRRGKEDDAEA